MVNMPGFPAPLRTPREVATTLASRVKELRLLRNWKRATLAERANLSVSSLKRFEASGKISFDGFLRICEALDRLPEVDGLLRPPPARSIAELEGRSSSRPKRGRL